MEVDPSFFNQAYKENLSHSDANTFHTKVKVAKPAQGTPKGSLHATRKTLVSSSPMQTEEGYSTPHEQKPTATVSALQTLTTTMLDNIRQQESFYAEYPDHCLVLPKNLLRSLLLETVPLQKKSVLEILSKESAIHLLRGLEKQIIAGDEMPMENETYQLVMASTEACIVALYIMTSKFPPKYLLIEEVIESIVSFTKFHLEENIFVNADKELGKADNKMFKKLFNKLGDILVKAKDLLSSVRLPDSMVLQLTCISLPVFFIDGVDKLHLRSMDLLRSVFAEYTHHRSAILQELFHSLLKLPKTKRNLRKFKVIGECFSIQMVSALLLQLIQSCVTCLDEISLKESCVVCRTLLTLFLQKCTPGSDHQAEYKYILENLVADLLAVMYLPDWPAAEIMISTLSTMLVTILNSSHIASMKNGGLPEMNCKKSKETDQMRLLALKLLGTIGTRLAAEVRQSNAFTLFTEKKRNETALPSDEEEDASCICGQGYKKKFMLDCDRCNVWFHGECVGISPSDVPEEWFCDTCQILLQAKDQMIDFTAPSIKKKKKKNKKEEEEAKVAEVESQDILGNDAARKQISLKLIMNYLLKNEKAALVARKFTCSNFQRLLPEMKESSPQLFKELWSQVPRRGVTELSLTYRGTINLIRYLCDKELQTRFRSILSSILHICNDRQMSFRTAAVKAITSIIDMKPDLLHQEDISKVVNERRLDVSVSVRQAIVDLVGKYVLIDKFTDQYYNIIVDRIADTGISVRKKVIKILTSICLDSPHHPRVVAICAKLVTRMNDEESIKSLVLRTFQELWFHGANSTTNTSSSPLSEADDLDLRLQQMNAVTSATSSHKWFVDLLHSLLHSKEKEKKSKQVRNMCAKLCRHIVQKMIETEETFNTRETLPQCTTALVQYLTILNLFCQADATLLTPHAMTLHPYLQTEQSKKGGALLYCQVIEILERVVPLLREGISAESKLAIEEDLSHLIQHHSSMKVVQASIRCLCMVVVHVTKHSIFLEEMLTSFCDILQTEEIENHQPANCMRAVFASGILCRYYDFDKQSTPTANTWKQNRTNKAPNSSKVFSILLTFIQKKNIIPSIQIKALQGLGHLLVRFPSLMLRCTELFRSILSTPNHLCTSFLLHNFGDFLLQEQASLEAGGATSAPENVQLVRDHSDSGARVIQSLLSVILPLTIQPSASLRCDALQVVGLLVKHGLAHPVKVIPFLIALLADRGSTVTQQAFHWLQFIHEKNPSLLLHRLPDGIKLSFSFQQKTFQHANALTLSIHSQGPESLLAQLYRLFRTKRSTREQFLGVIISQMESSPENGSFLKYLADLLVFLPFELVGEPLAVIHAVDRISALHTGAILKAFKKALHAQVEVERHCLQACLPIILIKMKAFLKWAYSLSSKKCESYSPNDALNHSPCIKLIDTASIISPCHGIPVLSASNVTLDLCEQQFSLLKQLFSQDDSDSYTDAVQRVSKKKMSPPKSQKKKKRNTDVKNRDIPSAVVGCRDSTPVVVKERKFGRKIIPPLPPKRARKKVDYSKMGDQEELSEEMEEIFPSSMLSRKRKRDKHSNDDEEEPLPKRAKTSHSQEDYIPE